LIVGGTMGDKEEQDCRPSAITSPRPPRNSVAGSRWVGGTVGNTCLESATESYDSTPIPHKRTAELAGFRGTFTETHLQRCL